MLSMKSLSWMVVFRVCLGKANSVSLVNLAKVLHGRRESICRVSEHLRQRHCVWPSRPGLGHWPVQCSLDFLSWPSLHTLGFVHSLIYLLFQLGYPSLQPSQLRKELSIAQMAFPVASSGFKSWLSMEFVVTAGDMTTLADFWLENAQLHESGFRAAVNIDIGKALA
ncbi:hypothetical protein F5Y17DRAFT_448873 [Xylariaceae sp. FL0594]|nr:hypothetical protein F5Y17DRAFT_448873 [Xylariaceae sp. FL0594]